MHGGLQETKTHEGVAHRKSYLRLSLIAVCWVNHPKMTNPTLILTSKSLDDTLFAETVAGALGLPFRFLTQAEIIKHLNREACKDPVFYSLMTPDCVRWFIKDILPRLRSKSAPVHPELVNVIGSLEHENLKELADTEILGSFVHRSPVGPKEAAQAFAELARPMLLRRLGIKKEVKAGKTATPWGFEVREQDAKPAALRELEELLTKHTTYPPKIVDATLLTTDELLTRAFAGCPTGQDLSHPIDVTVLSEGDELRLTVADRIGALKRSEFLAGILSDSLDPSHGGPTKGLGLIFRRGGSLSFRCVPGRSTEATAYYRLSKNYRSLLEQARFVCVQGGA